MPVPWTAKHQVIHEVENRAITIQQLRDLHLLIERLCKTRLLWKKAPDGQKSTPISIFEINMYDITNLIIKPAIRHAEEKRRGETEVDNSQFEGYSWVEFVVPEGCKAQKPEIMFSHSWAGRFQDFMSIVNNLERTNNYGGDKGIWICTFANNQFGQDFGVNLEESPFYNAIQNAGQVVLVVDRDASSLRRTWCGFEMFVTTQGKGKDLAIYTSVGQVGKEVLSGPLIDAVEVWDVRQTEASEPTDRRQILNYLAYQSPNLRSMREADGLVRNDGKIALDKNKRKQLDGDGPDESLAPRVRANGEREYAHEAGLFSRLPERFEALNKAVREKVKKSAGADANTKDQQHRELPPLDKRSITLGELRRQAKKRRIKADTKGPPLEGRTLESVAKECQREGMIRHTQQAAHYIIHEVKEMTWLDTMSAIEWAAEALQLRDSTVLFVPSLSVLEWSADLLKDWPNTIEVLIKSSYGWITILGTKIGHIHRMTRLQQMVLCCRHARPIYFACATGILSGLQPFVNPSYGHSGPCYEFGSFDPTVADLLLNTKWEEDMPECQDEAFAEKVAQLVHEMKGRLQGFLVKAAAGPVLRHAVLNRQNVKEVGRICRDRLLKINSQQMRGALGQTPLHIAAAVGNVRAMEVLLAAQADPNAEDNFLETPLHYAALAGKAAAAKCLMAHGARLEMASACAQTPLDVARECPAGFLQVNTETVVKLLKSWDLGDRHKRAP